MGLHYVPVGTRSFPFSAARKFIEDGYTTFIETGSYLGETALEASHDFDFVYTLEAADKYYKLAEATCAEAPNVTCVHGASQDMLRQVITECGKNKILFWLDAHYSGGETFENACPLLQELDLINELCEEPVVFVDDARFILMKYDGERYAPIYDVIKRLSEDGSRSVSLMGDCFIAVPTKYEHILNELSAEYSQEELKILSEHAAENKYMGMLSCLKTKLIHFLGR